MIRAWYMGFRVFAFLVSLVGGVVALYVYRQFVGGELANAIFYTFLLLSVYEVWRVVAFLTSQVVFFPLGYPVFSGERFSFRGEVRFLLPPPPMLFTLDFELTSLISDEKCGSIRTAQFFAFGRHAPLHVAFADLPRGVYRFSFGISSAPLLYGSRFSLQRLGRTAYAAVLPSPFFRTKPVRHKSSLEVFLDPAEFRPYQPGDPLSHISWKTFARGRGLWVRGGEVRRRPLVLLLDRHVRYSSEVSSSGLGVGGGKMRIPLFERMLGEVTRTLYAAARAGRPTTVVTFPALQSKEEEVLARLEIAIREGSLLTGLPRPPKSLRSPVSDRTWFLLAVLFPGFLVHGTGARFLRSSARFRTAFSQRNTSFLHLTREASFREAETIVFRVRNSVLHPRKRETRVRERGL